MKLRSALSASAIGLLIAATYAVPAHSYDSKSPLDVPIIHSVEVTEPSGVATDEPTEPTNTPTPKEPIESSEPTVPSEPPTPSVPQGPTGPKESHAPKDPTVPAEPKVPSKPATPIVPPAPTKVTEQPPARQAPTKLWKTTLPAVPTEPQADPILPTTPEAPSELTTTPTPQGEELTEEPASPTESEALEEFGVSSGADTNVYGSVARDARVRVLTGDATAPQLRGEFLAERVPWDRPEGVAPTASPVAIAEQTVAQTGAITAALLLGGILLMTAGAFLVSWGRRANHKREASLEPASSEI